MSKNLQLFCLTLFSASMLNSQTNQSIPCGNTLPPQQWEDWLSEKVTQYKQNQMQNKTQLVQHVIPVIVHVIHTGQAAGTFPNISAAQIQSQLDVLNEDFGGIGLNAANVPAAFAGKMVGNTGISFCLATLDPGGAPLAEPGINRMLDAAAQGWGDPTAAPDIHAYMTETVIPVANAWDPTKYFNIWISDRKPTETIRGFATYPPSPGVSGMFGAAVGSSTLDGIWVWTRAFGTIGTLTAPFNKGRTATHETGHWLGLRHLWGDGNCLPDYCDDTPPAKNANTGCPTFPLNIDYCGVGQSTDGEMFMNYMDMTNDDCKFMFTNDQNIRMQTVLSHSPHRNLLGTHDLCIPPLTNSAVAVAGFTLAKKPCVNKTFVPFNTSSGYPLPSYAWSSVPPAQFLPNPTVPNPSVIFSTKGNYTLTLVTTNTVNSSSYTMAISSVEECPDGSSCLDSIKPLKVVDTLEVYAAPVSTAITACTNSNNTGYLTGTSCYKDKAFAQYYRASSYTATPNPQINSVIVLFDNDGTAGGINSPVVCKIYGGSVSSGPVSVMATKITNLGSIMSAIDKTTSISYLGDQTVVFGTPKIIPYKFDFEVPVIINNPANGFYVGIDFADFNVNDKIRIFSNKKNNTSSVNDSSSWVLNSLNNWRPLKNYRGARVQLAIIPQITCSPLIIGVNDGKTEFNSNVSLVPNPNNGVFSLVFTLPTQQDVSVKIYNTIGQVISAQQIHNVGSNVIDVDLSNKPAGIYFTEISNGTERVTKKVIVAH